MAVSGWFTDDCSAEGYKGATRGRGRHYLLHVVNVSASSLEYISANAKISGNLELSIYFCFEKKAPAVLFSCGYCAGTAGTLAGTALFGYPVVPVRYPLFFFQRVPFFLSFLCCYVKVPEVPAISHIYAL